MDEMWAIAVMAIGIAASISTRKVLVARLQQRGALDARLVLDRLDALQARLAHLEQVAETTAVEGERLGDGQRFLTRAAGEAAGSARIAGAPAPQVLTPH